MGIERNKIEEKYKWNIDTIYPDKEKIDSDINKVKDIMKEIQKYRGKLSENKDNLYNTLNLSEQASRIVQNLYVYTHMKQHEDTRINSNQGLATKTDMLATELSTSVSYMVPEIISMDEN
ncbi:MAG TPA: oligoendopeptidase F, partial [Peptostreptococcaceae bacterium]|nr:oligoendopeptidase F [Peptostreptococcaceae bacterium]